ncbi:heavy-metal-associated domain-containing protein [Dysgonomonas sp. Marseille-P4677]|uniref:heavy-metal-associated domain-containing protein n=1 Tax=Dysgonomonas sp. Marseille-P4677 TaxID=2364790 RepID=UPI001912D7FD|nr:heavy metal-associated domain-containing protein [Dysgonomonas sp. Marseille-P4677]MBK5721958.1 heavy-metal-associated domain-containing protein [Dysgonomonas sp. Marseille-P4677]
MEKVYTNLRYEILTVRGNCDICKESIEKAALGVRGVVSAVWEIQSGRLKVGFDPDFTTLNEISKAIAKAGHSTEKDDADPNAHAALPECCK